VPPSTHCLILYRAFLINMNLSQQDAEVNRLEDKKVRVSTKATYRSPQVKFLLYLLDNHVEATSKGLSDAAGTLAGKKRKLAVRTYLNSSFALKTSPILFDQVTTDDVKRFFATLTKQDGTKVGLSGVGTARSSVLHLYSSFNKVLHSRINWCEIFEFCLLQQMPAEMEAALTVLWKGIKRDVQDRKADWDLPVEEGKSPLPIDLYELLMLKMFMSERAEGPFTHLYSLLSLNLGCRSNNTAGIAFSHFSWQIDALGCLFMHHKADQEGEMAKYMRHLFANPKKPHMCVILSLGIYLACTPPAPNAVKLFAGPKQDNRYLKVICWILIGFVDSI
jgi:hypothetical protein